MIAHLVYGDDMTTINFDTLQFAKRAEKVGFTKEQAEFQAEEMAKMIDSHIASKEDMRHLSQEIELFKKDMMAMENRIILKVGGMMVVAFSVFGAVMKLLGVST